MTAQLRPDKPKESRRSRPVRRSHRNHRFHPSEATIDLRSQYPIALRVILKRSFSWVAGWIGFLGILVAVHAGTSNHLFDSPAGQVVLSGFIIASAIFIAKLTYEILYRASYYYAIEAGYLVISKGIIIRQRGSFPLSRITDVYLDRSVSDFIFGLYDLHVSTPTIDSGRFARIDGLPRDSAVHLQRSLVSLIEVTHSVSGDRPARRINEKEQAVETTIHEK